MERERDLPIQNHYPIYEFHCRITCQHRRQSGRVRRPASGSSRRSSRPSWYGGSRGTTATRRLLCWPRQWLRMAPSWNEARAWRRELAQLDRNRSGAHKALGVLRFISTKTDDTVDAWNQVQSNFNVLAKDSFLYRAAFAQCIGPIVRTHSSSLFCFLFFWSCLIFVFFYRNERFKGVCSGDLRCVKAPETKARG
jgi:hypothetical protein